MSQMLTLDRAQEILLTAHSTVTQVQHSMFYWFRGRGSNGDVETPCFCAIGLLAYEGGFCGLADIVVYDRDTGRPTPTGDGGVFPMGKPIGPYTEEDAIFKAMGIPQSLGWLIATWNDQYGWSFDRIALELPRYWVFDGWLGATDASYEHRIDDGEGI